MVIDMKKTCSAILLIGVLISMLLLSGAASDVNVGEIDFYDHELTGETLSITPEAYTENAKAVLQNYAIDDLEKIEAICKTFL